MRNEAFLPNLAEGVLCRIASNFPNDLSGFVKVSQEVRISIAKVSYCCPWSIKNGFPHFFLPHGNKRQTFIAQIKISAPWRNKKHLILLLYYQSINRGTNVRGHLSAAHLQYQSLCSFVFETRLKKQRALRTPTPTRINCFIFTVC